MRRIIGMVGFLLLSIAAVAQTSVDAPKVDRLRNQVRGVEAGDVSVRDAAVQLFRGSGIPGGIELVHCGTWLPLVRIDPGSSVRTALGQIALAQELSVDESTPGGIVNLREQLQPPALLDVRISTVQIPSRQAGGSALAALRNVLLTPEVHRAMAKLSMSEVLPEIGFTSLPKSGPVQSSPTVLKNLTVRDALNYIALRSGRGVWVYDEQRCQSPTTTFTISFPVQ